LIVTPRALQADGRRVYAVFLIMDVPLAEPAPPKLDPTSLANLRKPPPSPSEQRCLAQRPPPLRSSC
jgi:hypothetical protein